MKMKERREMVRGEKIRQIKRENQDGKGPKDEKTKGPKDAVMEKRKVQSRSRTKGQA